MGRVACGLLPDQQGIEETREVKIAGGRDPSLRFGISESVINSLFVETRKESR